MKEKEQILKQIDHDFVHYKDPLGSSTRKFLDCRERSLHSARENPVADAANTYAPSPIRTLFNIQ